MPKTEDTINAVMSAMLLALPEVGGAVLPRSKIDIARGLVDRNLATLRRRDPKDPEWIVVSLTAEGRRLQKTTQEVLAEWPRPPA